jgi:hypothetical protein
VLKIIDNEITKRLENGTMDEDELKDELWQKVIWLN